MKLRSMFQADPPDGLDPIREALRAAEPGDPPRPWHRSAEMAVGGLVAVGFDRGGEDLLVVSSDGQSVIDCASGEILHRDRATDGYDRAALKAERRDHPAAERFDMAGLDGGALPCVTRDGWSVMQFTLTWPEVHAVLHPPGASVLSLKPAVAQYDKDTRFHLLSRGHEPLRAFGFSWTGQSLVLATPSDLRIWTRAALPLR